MQTKTFTLKTKEFFAIENLTPLVEEFLKDVEAKDGLVNVFTQHTTVSIKINEAEVGFYKDIKKTMSENIARVDDTYHHNDLENRDPSTLCPISKEECLNGHSHVSQMLLGSASETIPVIGGKMRLGTWQQILMIELDHSRERRVIVSFTGNRKS